MPRVSKPVNAQLIEFQCACGKGIFRRDQSKPVRFEYPMSYPHKCTHCGLEGGFPVAYPLLETTSHNRQRNFMLEDEMPKPSGPAMNEKPQQLFLWLK
jgi:hypothetical protein